MKNQVRNNQYITYIIWLIAICAVVVVSIYDLLGVPDELQGQKGCIFELKNTEKVGLVGSVYHIDHGLIGWPYPISVMGSELEPGASFIGARMERPGKYVADWYLTTDRHGVYSRYSFLVWPGDQWLVIGCTNIERKQRFKGEKL